MLLELQDICFERDNKKILKNINLELEQKNIKKYKFRTRHRKIYCNNRAKWIWKINISKNHNGD